MNKAIEEINKRIEMWEERLEEEKQRAIENIEDMKNSLNGITKYSEEITRIIAKIEAYRESVMIIEFRETEQIVENRKDMYKKLSEL